MNTGIIKISGLSKVYGDFKAVDDLHLTIGKGEIFGLLGPNGAGKSTTMLMLMGLSEPDAGTVEVCGINPQQQPLRVKQKVGYLPEDVGFYADMTGKENLLYTAGLNGMSRAEAIAKVNVLLERVGLAADATKKTGAYSRGMRQRLGLADVLVKNPEVIILDEPTLGIDPSGVRDFLDLIVRLSREDGITVLFSSHHLHQVQQVCDRVGIFVKGKLLAEGDVPSLARQLFATEGFTVALGIEEAASDKMSEVQQKLSAIEGVERVKTVDKHLELECTRDVASEAASAVVHGGAALSFLTKKEYGLDDIYYRYFEGGNTNG